MRDRFQNVSGAIQTHAQVNFITLGYSLQTYLRQVFADRFEHPNLSVSIKPRYRGFDRFEQTSGEPGLDQSTDTSSEELSRR